MEGTKIQRPLSQSPASAPSFKRTSGLPKFHKQFKVSSGTAKSLSAAILSKLSLEKESSSSPTAKMTQTPPQQYCLRWNNYQNNLTNVFDQLLQSEAFVDVTLACDGHSIKAHKMVLSACSPFFQTLFFDNPCSHPIVILKDISWDELKAVVEFMYRGEINVSQEQLAPLLKVAEMLKIRGLADVSRGSGGANGSHQGSRDGHGSSNESGSSGLHRNGPNPADFMSTSNHDSEPGSPINSNGHLLNHPLLQGHHLSPLNSLLNPNGSTTASSAAAAAAHAQALASLHRRKRRKMSTPERTPSPPEDDLDDHSSNQLEIDSQNGDWNNEHSPPRPMTADRASSSGGGDPSARDHPGRESSGVGMSMSLSSTPTPANTPSLSAAAAAAATVGMSLAGGSSLGSTSASSLVGPMGPAFLNLHAAAAAAAAVANANSSAGGGGSGSNVGGGNGGNNPPSTSSSLASDMDLKPGIVEMIREEERAKMLESSHGWLGPSAASSLTDTYQYQIQNLWQKCWNQNQGGVVHALRFRERGPLKSWRPETMAEAIFAVLRDGLSLSQAARKYDIPYPTFVLYANRVHNMLGPSADGCTGSDLMSDMRPKGRGRPQRILLGSWPEEHIRGVIRAVVFRDTQGGKDDFPFIFNRETGLCLPQTPGSSSHNGLDMSLQQFGNPFLNPSGSGSNSNSTSSAVAAAAANLLHQLQPPQSSTPHTTSSSSLTTSSSALGGGNSSSSSAGAQQNATNLSSSAGASTSTTTASGHHGVNLININDHGPTSLSAAAAATAAALQHLQQLQQQGTLSASTTAALTPGSPSSSSTSNSPLHQVLSSAGILSAQAQRELLALQQRHQQQLQQHHQRRHSLSAPGSRDSRDGDISPLGLLSRKALSSIISANEVVSSKEVDDCSTSPLISNAEILQIKAELPSSLGGGGDDDDDAEDVNEAMDGNNLSSMSSSNRHKIGGDDDEELDDDNNDDHAGVIPLNEGDDEEMPFATAFKQSVNNPGQSLAGSSSGCGQGIVDAAAAAAAVLEEQTRLQADFVKFLNRNSTSPDDISGNNGNGSGSSTGGAGSGNSPKNSRSSNCSRDSNGNANSNNNNNDSPKGSSSSSNGNGNNNNNAGNSNSHSGSRSNETSSSSSGNGNNTLVVASLAGQDGQEEAMMMTMMSTTTSSTTSSSSSSTTTSSLESPASRRASLRAATIASSISSLGESSGGGGGGGIGVTGTCSTTSTATSAGISTRMRSSSSSRGGGGNGGEREVNTPSPLNFHQNQARRVLRHLP